MRVHLYHNPRSTGKRWAVGHLPRRQTLIWAGPVFLLVQRRPRFTA